jgi:hypothetical protein
MLKQARLNKLCNFTGPQDRDDNGWIKIIGYYGKDKTPQVGNVVKVSSWHNVPTAAKLIAFP